MSNRRFRLKAAVNLGALSNGRRKQTDSVAEQTEEPVVKQDELPPVEFKIKEEAITVDNPSEVLAPQRLETQEVTRTDTSKDDSPFSPPAPPAPNANGLRGIRFKAKFKPNLTDKSRIRRYSGTLSDLGSPQMVGSPCKKVRTISCSSSTENDSDVDQINQEEVLMKKPPLIQRIVSSNDTVTSTTQVAPSPERWPRQSPAHQPDYEIKSTQHPIICPSPRQRHLTESREIVESIDSRDPSVLEVRKADYKKKFTTGVPERTTMTMFDLIYYNPGTGSRMSNSNSRSSTRSGSRLNSRTSSIVDPKEESQMRLEAVRQRLEEEAVDDVQAIDDENNGTMNIEEEEDAMPVPQVKVGPDGSIIVDDSSTLIETTAAKKAKEDLLKTQLIFETADKTSNYGSWLKRKKAVDWTEKETVRFFKAMSILGTDFSLMEKLFKRRTRHELKMKYKKEEKANKALIDRCLTKGLQFDLSVMESEDDEEIEPVKQPPVKQRKPRKKADQVPKQKKRKRGYYISSDDEPAIEVQPPKTKRRKKTQLGITEILNQGIDIVSTIYQNHASDMEVIYTQNKQNGENHVSSATPSTPSTSRPADQGSGSLLKSLLTRNISASPQQSGFAFPPALLAANPSLANAAPGSLVVVASPNGYSTDDSQVLQVFVVGESPGDGRLQDNLDIAVSNDDQPHDIIIQDSLDSIVPLA